jgi:hypothetical protein
MHNKYLHNYMHIKHIKIILNLYIRLKNFSNIDWVFNIFAIAFNNLYDFYLY